MIEQTPFFPATKTKNQPLINAERTVGIGASICGNTDVRFGVGAEWLGPDMALALRAKPILGHGMPVETAVVETRERVALIGAVD